MNRLERLGLEMAEHVEDSAIGGEGGGNQGSAYSLREFI